MTKEKTGRNLMMVVERKCCGRECAAEEVPL